MPDAPPKSLDDLLSPKAIGGSPTEAKNDPMMDSDLVIQGVSGFVERKKSAEFSLDYSQYLTLIEESYTAQTTCDRGLAKFVPQSAYAYYMIIALWRRLYQITSRRWGINTYDEIERAIPEMHVPKEIKLYLDGLGNITDHEMKTWHLHFKEELFVDQAHYGAQGSFGRVDTNTHIRYETMPAPIIALLTILADMRFSDPDIKGARHWPLPDDMTPETPTGGTAPGLPNPNLLGYRLAKKLSLDQMGVLQDNGFHVGKNWDDSVITARNLGRIPIIQSLISFLTGQFKHSKCPMEPYNTIPITGSLSQVPFTKRVSDDVNPEWSRRAVAKTGTTYSHRQTTSHIAVGAIIFRYRFKRKNSDRTSDCYCYYWLDRNNAPQIPPPWIQNEDSVFEGTSKWNIDDFTSGTQDGEGVAAELAIRTKKKNEKR